MAKKIPVIEVIDNPDGRGFAGVPINKEGDIAIIDLRNIKAIVEDAKERIRKLKLSIIGAADGYTKSKITTEVKDLTQKLMDYTWSRNN